MRRQSHLTKMIKEVDEKDFFQLIEVSSSDGFEHPKSITLAWIQNRIMLGDRFYAFYENNKILGFVCFQPQFSSGSRLHYLSVRQDEQGRGIGSVLLEEAEKLARNHSKNKLYLWVHQKNKKALAFYLKHGFDFSGIFLDKYGEGGNALLMVKKLE